jgi:predicted ATPase
VAAVVAHWTTGVTCWFGGDYLNARLHLERALAIYEAEPDPATFKASALDLPFVIMRFLALVLWPLGRIDRSRRLAAEAARATGDKPALSQANALVHKAVFDGLCGGMLQETETILALGLAREHTMPLYVAAGSYLNGLAKWRAGDRMDGLSEMQRGWTLLHENDCYLCEPFWGMQVAVANAEAGQFEAGLEILRELVSSTEQSGQHWLDAELHRSRSELLLRLDPPNVSMAEDTFHRALEIARTQQTKTFELRSAIGLAHLYRANGRAEAIPELLAPVLVDFDTERDLSEIAEAETLLKRGEAAQRGNW